MKVRYFLLACLLGVTQSQVAVPANFWGTHYNHTTALYPPVAPLVFKTNGLWDSGTGWADMQSNANCTHTVTTGCNFTKLDTWLNKLVSPNAKLILTLAKTPNFIAANTSDANCGYTSSLGSPNGSCTPPTDINCDGTGTDATFINFVTALWDHLTAGGFTGRITGLEIWNEWNVPVFWDTTYIDNTLCAGSTGFTVAGSVTSGAFSVGHVVKQATTNATATLVNAPTGNQSMVIGVITVGTANSSSIWTDQTSGATFTPTASPKPSASRVILARMEQDARCILKTNGTTTCNAGGTYPVKGAENAVLVLSSPLPGPGNNDAQVKSGGAEDAYLAVGGGLYADQISIHGYLNSKGNTTAASCGAAPGNVGCMWPENVVTMVNDLNSLQTTYGLSLPVVISEGSWGAQSSTTDAQFEQAFVPRYMALMAQYGVQVFDWYNTDGGSVSLPVLYADNNLGTLTTGGAAYQTIQQWLTGKTFSNSTATITAAPSCSGGAGSNTYALPLTSGEKLVWYDEVADNASCAYSTISGFSSYLTMNGGNIPISGAPSIILDNRPILLEPGGAAPSPPTQIGGATTFGGATVIH